RRRVALFARRPRVAAPSAHHRATTADPDLDRLVAPFARRPRVAAPSAHHRATTADPDLDRLVALFARRRRVADSRRRRGVAAFLSRFRRRPSRVR
ncbi:hypothetical protein, partial [Amycolatopsis kentuckyensis]|uniref:hypothetical protein n=1 Tax=Amycolatopsis kentuckyensis TaxID=218823 RepID=UPI0013027D1F